MFKSRFLSALLIALVVAGCGGKDKKTGGGGKKTPLSEAQKTSRIAIEDMGATLYGREAVQVRFLDVTRVNDEQLKKLKEVDNIAQVDIRDMNITDAGMKTLCEIESITDLNLKGTKITDAGMAHVKNLKNLTSITLPEQVGDKGVAHLAGLKSLKTFRAGNSKITDAALKHISTCSELRVVDLESCDITDAGIAELAKLKNLGNCNLKGLKITDACLPHFKDMKLISELYLYNNKGMTKKAVEKLNQELKSADIYGPEPDPGTPDGPPADIQLGPSREDFKQK